MCDVPSIAVFCSESIECFPGTASKFFFKLLVTIPVASTRKTLDRFTTKDSYTWNITHNTDIIIIIIIIITGFLFLLM
jgi:hypothetical protein